MTHPRFLQLCEGAIFTAKVETQGKANNSLKFMEVLLLLLFMVCTTCLEGIDNNLAKLASNRYITDLANGME